MSDDFIVYNRYIDYTMLDVWKTVDIWQNMYLKNIHIGILIWIYEKFNNLL